MVQNNYIWEAEKLDGAIITRGESLAGCVRFSLIPQAAGLPRHDVIGIPLHRRFGRGFVRVLGGKTPEYLHCVVCDGFRLYVTSSDGSILITPYDHEVYL